MKPFRRAAFLRLLVGVATLAAACGQDAVPTGGDASAAPETSSLTPTRVEGHRGARGLKPENTLPSFEAALDAGVTVLELDLHLSADNQLVIWHDDEFGPDKCSLTDDAPASAVDPSEGDGVAIRELRIDDLQYYRCDTNPDPGRFPDQENSPTALAGDWYRPLTLPELFEFVERYATSSEKTARQRDGAAAVEFNMETKRDPSGRDNIGDGFNGTEPGRFEVELLAAIEAAGVEQRSVIQSFDHRSLWAIRSVNSDIRLSALSSRNTPDLEELANNGADIWSPDFRRLTARLITEAHDLGLLVIPWTVNEVDDMKRLLDLGVDGIITDRPDVAVDLP